ncbi:IPT/TIG domain-containing protein [Pontibacter chitinilyticus]|uniref:IPT/TIG domain-containing protein n=1 Tax=Pontibacter chitinilyticus TaxID=2674989 RepID=UPI00321938AC
MRNFYNLKLLLLLCLVLSFGILVSCNDDDDATPNTGQVELLSFGPTGVQHGEEIRFIGHNLNKVEAVELAGVTVNKADFIEQTSDLIRMIVPQEAMEGKVTLDVTGGEKVISKTVLSFNVPITITSMTEKAKPGTNITLTGTKLTWVEGVVFGQDTVDTFVNQTPTELVLQVPMTAKTGTLLILGGGTDPVAVETENELEVVLPQATSMSPNPINNGANLTIKGTDLDLVKEIHFTGVGDAIATTFVSQTPTQIVVKVPDNASMGKLTLVALSGVEVTTDEDLTLVLPAVTALAPNPVKHGDNLTITGTNLNLVDKITFVGVGEAVATKFVSKSANQIVVTVPDNASKGVLKLTAHSGVQVTSSLELNIILPAITSLSPAPVDPGQNLTISGTNLDLVKSIAFQGGAVASTFVSQSANQIVVKVPMDAKKGALTLTTVKDYVVATDAKVSIILPEITSVTPEPVIAGNYLTISGSELDQVKSIVFTGGATVSSFVAQNAKQLVLLVPADAETGVLSLITKSGFTVKTDKQAKIGTAGPDITEYIYQDALSNKWEKWGGWGTTAQVMDDTTNVNNGSNAIKIEYNDGYGALQLHPKSANVLQGYSTLVLYVRGGASDSRVAIQVKNAAGASLADVPFDVKAGEYKLIEIPISSLGDVSGGLAELYIKNYGTNPNTIYVDDFGLR